MKIFLQKNHRLVFFGLLLLLGLMQAGLTELQDDEAYYWVFSRYMDWGYFDHPPMTALLVKMGYAIFPNELGVRLFPLLLNIFSLLIIEKLIAKKNIFLFYAIVLSIAVIQVAGFMAIPDTPLLFFTALFFLCYNRFTEKLSLVNTLLLGISVALLLYSKYHGVLVILFTLLSNIKLFRKYQTYIAGIVALLLFAPHLWWQYQHDWISIRYHLFESNVNPYKASYTFNYIMGQLLLPGPIAGFILLPAAFLYKTKTTTEKALRFTMFGIYAFFLFSCFRGKTEVNWTLPALIPLIILSHQYLNEKIAWQKWLFKLLPVTVIFVLFARVAMIVDILPLKEIKTRFYSWQTWPKEMKERTHGLPVIFSDSYQRASKYWFYSGQMTFSQNWYRNRPNNYDLWPVEDSIVGKPAYFMDIFQLSSRFTDSVQTAIGWVGYRYDPAIPSFAKIKIAVGTKTIRIKQGELVTMNAVAAIPKVYFDFISATPGLQSTLTAGIFNKKGWIKDYVTQYTVYQITGQPFIIRFDPGLPKGKYYILFSIRCNDYNATRNSDKIELIVE